MNLKPLNDLFQEDRLTRDKAKSILTNPALSYKITGIAMTNDAGNTCIVNNSAVRWLTKGENWELMQGAEPEPTGLIYRITNLLLAYADELQRVVLLKEPVDLQHAAKGEQRIIDVANLEVELHKLLDELRELNPPLFDHIMLREKKEGE